MQAHGLKVPASAFSIFYFLIWGNSRLEMSSYLWVKARVMLFAAMVLKSLCDRRLKVRRAFLERHDLTTWDLIFLQKFSPHPEVNKNITY